MAEFVILMSCMHQHDHSILVRSNVQSNIVVVNQCDIDKTEEFEFTNKYGQNKWCKFISTTKRGLSKSRNMALQNAPNDSICLIADDDETFDDNVENTILDSFDRYPMADLIAFSLIRKDLKTKKVYPTSHRLLKFRQIMNTSSLQLAFKISSVKAYGVQFDVKMGSGTGNGGGEENKFMLDMRRAGASMHYSPECIATVNPGESQWFKGYTPTHLQNIGWSSRRSMGAFTGFAYINYWVLTHRRFYGSDISPLKAYVNIFKGYFSRR